MIIDFPFSYLCLKTAHGYLHSTSWPGGLWWYNGKSWQTLNIQIFQPRDIKAVALIVQPFFDDVGSDFSSRNFWRWKWKLYRWAGDIVKIERLGLRRYTWSRMKTGKCLIFEIHSKKILNSHLKIKKGSGNYYWFQCFYRSKH